jgi:hypothetical protein
MAQSFCLELNWKYEGLLDNILYFGKLYLNLEPEDRSIKKLL